MREIKFRAWVNNEKMINVQSIDFGYEVVEAKTNKQFFFETDNVKLMQYTGLKDKNGVEVYEGDIIGYPENFNDKTMMEIRWARPNAYLGEQWCEFEIQNWDGKEMNPDKPSDYYGGVNPEDKIVVGNIFEGVVYG